MRKAKGYPRNVHTKLEKCTFPHFSHLKQILVVVKNRGKCTFSDLPISHVFRVIVKTGKNALFPIALVNLVFNYQ